MISNWNFSSDKKLFLHYELCFETPNLAASIKLSHSIEGNWASSVAIVSCFAVKRSYIGLNLKADSEEVTGFVVGVFRMVWKQNYLNYWSLGNYYYYSFD